MARLGHRRIEQRTLTLQQLIEGLNREHLTTMLSHEFGNYSEERATLEAADSLVDTVIRLRRTLSNRRILRSLEIVKSRGQDYEPGEHTLAIRDGAGLEIFRRVQAPARVNLEQPTSTARRSVIVFGEGLSAAHPVRMRTRVTSVRMRRMNRP